MWGDEDASGNSAKAHVAVLRLTLLSSVWLHVYSDEVMSKFYAFRIFLDSVQLTTVFPLCAPSLGHAVAWGGYPTASILSLTFQDLKPLGIRASGWSARWSGLHCWRGVAVDSNTGIGAGVSH